MTTTFTNNSNANRAARKLIAAGKAPATAFDIIKVDGAFAIEWAKPEAEKPAKVARDRKPQTADEAFKASRAATSPKAALPGDDKAGAVAAAKGMLLGDKQSRRAGLEKLVRLGVADSEVDAALAAAAEQIAKTAAPSAQSARAAYRPRSVNGQLPAPPDLSKPTHKGWRGKLAAIVALATAGDVAGLRAYPIEPKSSTRAMICRYRDAAVTALEARPPGK